MNLERLVGQLSIRTDRGTIERLRPNWAQRDVLAEVERQRVAHDPVRIITLKARQLGMSTITEALLFNHGFLWEHMFSMVMAHKTDSAEGIFDMTRRYWETWPFKRLFTAKYHSKRELAWEETGSTIRIATAASGETGRGRTINFLHASEAAFWKDPEGLMAGLRQTIPNDPSSAIFVESTANGVGNWFHRMWTEAEEGNNEYTPLFFPWWRHPRYGATGAGLSLPELGRLDDEEKYLRAKLDVDDDHLKWRRWAIDNLVNGDVEMFHQEYPSTPEEAFITSGHNAFDLAKLRDCYEPLPGRRGILVPDSRGGFDFKASASGPLTVYRLPSSDRDWGQYFVGGDPAHAGGGDYACAQVINRRMYEQVATWHGHIDPIAFGDELAKIAKFYNEAEVAPEVEGPGYATIARLISLEYPHLWRHRWAERLPGKVAQIYGWSTNWKRKGWLVSELARLILDGSLRIHDPQTYAELRNYVAVPVAGGANMYDYEAPPGEHDDRVMALGIACICSMTEGPLLAYEDRDLQDVIEPIPEWAQTWMADRNA